MGKGDKKTKRGKIIMGSYGVRRPKKVEKSVVIIEKPKKAKDVKEETPAAKVTIAKTVTKKAPAKKTVAKKAEATKVPEEKTTIAPPDEPVVKE